LRRHRTRKPVAADTAGPPPPPVAAGALEGLLFNPAEINAAMGATGMTVLETSKQMWDSSNEVSDVECLGTYGAAEYMVYTGSGWSAMRYTSLQEPGEDPPHFAEQAVERIWCPRQDSNLRHRLLQG
jgi:hypothetical protein